jgi:hypothetical protein
VTEIAAIIPPLKRQRRRYLFSRVVRFAALASTVLLGLLTVLQFVFAVFPWTAFPIAWDASILGFFVSFGIFVLDSCFFRKPPLLHIAARIEKSLALKPRWISLALELSTSGAAGSVALKAEVLGRAEHFLAGRLPALSCPIPRIISVTCFFSLLSWCAASLLVKPSLSSYWDFPLTLGAAVKASVVPGSVTLPMNSSITLGCLPQAKGYPSCKMVVTENAGGMQQSLLLRPDSSGAFWQRRDNINRSFVYQFSIGMTVFAPETVRVALPPTLNSLTIRLVPPRYIGESQILLPEGQGNFSAYVGSSAQFTLSAPHALAQAALHSSRGDVFPFVVTGSQANGTIVIKNKCSYTFSLTDTLGQKNDSLPEFFIDLTADMPPLVQLLKPGNNKDLSPALVETLWVEAMDDIGLRQCSLWWRKNSEPSDTVHSRNLLAEGGKEKMFRAQYVWNLKECSLYPGDTLFYFACARDNYPFDTSHSCVTRTFWFRLPTFEEIHERIVQEHNAAENSLNVAREKEANLQGALSDLMKSARGKESLNWEQKQIVKDLEENFRAQSDTIANAVQSLKRVIEKLKEQGLSSRELVEKMDNIRKELEEIVRNYGDSLLFEPLRKNESAVNMRDLKESLQKFQKMLPDLAKRLDNALKYLEMLKRDRKLAALAGLAEKYGKEELACASSNTTGPDRLKQQNNLSGKIDTLVSELSREFEKTNDSALFSKGDVPSLETVQSMQRTMRGNLAKQSLPETGAMNRMSAGLFSMSQDLLDLQSSAMMRKLIREKELLLDMSHDALAMAMWQEQIRDELGTQNSFAQSQQALKQALMKSSDKLNKLSMTMPGLLRQFMKQYETAETSMDKSLQSLKNDMDASGAMNTSRENLDALAFSLMQAASSLNGQGSGEGCNSMMCGLQRLSGKQAMINGLTGEILRRMLGEKGSQGEQSGEGEDGDIHAGKARKQAQEAQQAVADELKKLAEKYGKDAENGLAKKAKELEEEARRLSRMLDNPQPEIQDRQDRFLSRMLQSTLSMHKQDSKEERKSQSAKNIFSAENTPIKGPILNEKDTFFRIRQKAFSGNFPESYRPAIKSYFDSLSVLYLRDK